MRQASPSSASESCAPSSRALKREAPMYTASAPLATAARTASRDPAGARSSGMLRCAIVLQYNSLAPFYEPQRGRGGEENDARPGEPCVVDALPVTPNHEPHAQPRQLQHRA